MRPLNVDVDAILRVYRSGRVPVKCIAYDYGCSLSFLRRLARRASVPPRKPTIYFHTNTDEIAEAYRSGDPIPMIAQKFDCCERTVLQIARRRSIPHRRRTPENTTTRS